MNLARFAGDQHGVVTRAQLFERGLTEGTIDRWVKAGRLHRVHRGVYALGHRVLTREGRWLAACLATGGVLSHISAAAAWELRPTDARLIHVTAPGDAGRKRRAGLKVHRSTTLAGQATVHRGIPITTPARTIVDLARTLSGRPLEHVIDLADQRGLVDFAELRQANSASLQAVLRTYAAAPTRSELEEAFLRLCDDHGIPRPETNTRIEGLEVDFAWRDRRLVVEVDGFRYHRSPLRFEWDREKDVTLETNGWRVLRFTWRHVQHRPGWVAGAVTGARRQPP